MGSSKNQWDGIKEINGFIMLYYGGIKYNRGIELQYVGFIYLMG